VAAPRDGGLGARAVTPGPHLERLDATVIGRVHGVGFRYFAVREAMALGLTGWVANDRNGTVNCVAEGPRADLEALLERLREGPPAAIVEEVRAAWMPATGAFTAFGVRSGDHGGD
jgi:acylphosphatase